MSKKNFFKVFMYLYFFVLHWLSFYFYLQYFVIKMCLKNTIFENYSILWNIICYVLLICQKIFFFLNCDMGDFSNPFLHLTKTRKKFVSKRRKRYIFSLKFWKIKENFLKRLNFCCCCICLYMWVFLDRILTGFLKINCDIIETDVKY